MENIAHGLVAMPMPTYILTLPYMCTHLFTDKSKLHVHVTTTKYTLFPSSIEYYGILCLLTF